MQQLISVCGRPLAVLAACALAMGSVPFAGQIFVHAATPYVLYVATNGNDGWSGTSSAPNAQQNDGPFASLDKARQAVFALKQSGQFITPVNVEIRAGTYVLNNPLTFNATDSGTPSQPITYEAYQNEAVSLSGGKKISTSWSASAGNPNIFVTHIPEVASGTWNFNALFVNDARATRARVPSAGSTFNLDPSVNTPAQNSLYGGGVFLIKNGEVNPAWSNLQDVEAVSDERWTQSRERITAVADSSQHVGYKTVTVTHPLNASGNGYGWDYANNDRYYLDNVFEGLTGPGEWYLNRHTGDLSYWPPAGQNPSQADIQAPFLQSLVNFQGQMNRLQLQQAPGFTLSYWLKTSQSEQLAMYNTTNLNGYEVGLLGGRMYVSLGTQQYSFAAKQILACNPTAVNDNAWHLLSATVDKASATLTCYVDGTAGAAVGYGVLDLGNNLNSLPVIGGYGTGLPPVQFLGSLDEVRVYNRVLAGSEVQTLFQHSVPTPAAGLQLALDFENSAQDSGPLSLSGSVNGQSAYVPGIRGQALQILPNANPSFQSGGVTFPNYAQPVHDIVLSGLKFEYNGQPLADSGFSDPIGSYSLPDAPAISLLGSQHIALQNNTFIHTGGFGVGQQASDTTSIRSNTFSDTAAGAIVISNNQGEVSTTRNTGNLLTDNTIHDTGKIYGSATAVILGRSLNSSVSHNLIYNNGYSGISVGLLQNPYGTEAANNTVEFNDIHDVVTETSDGAAIYAYGPGSGGTIRNNRIHDLPNGSGIYLDEQANGYALTNNLIYRALFGIELHNVNSDSATNNIVSDSHFNAAYFPLINGSGSDFSRNILYDTHATPSGSPYADDLTVANTVAADYNLYWTPQAPTAWNAVISTRQSKGYDVHSRNADPGFKDVAHDDFSIVASSPATSLGFVPFDVSGVGPRVLAAVPSTTTPMPLPTTVSLSLIDGQPMPASGTFFTTNHRPKFQGVAPPGTPILVTVHSDPLTCSAVAAADGSWNCALSQDLPSGSHTVEISSNGTLLATYRLAVVDSLPITGGKLPLLLGYLGLLAGASPLLYKRLSRRKHS